jgi:hypothetical protein
MNEQGAIAFEKWAHSSGFQYPEPQEDFDRMLEAFDAGWQAARAAGAEPIPDERELEQYEIYVGGEFLTPLVPFLRKYMAELEAALRYIDETLARRPALAGIEGRCAKIERACYMAGRAEEALSDRDQQIAYAHKVLGGNPSVHLHDKIAKREAAWQAWLGDFRSAWFAGKAELARQLLASSPQPIPETPTLDYQQAKGVAPSLNGMSPEEAVRRVRGHQPSAAQSIPEVKK